MRINTAEYLFNVTAKLTCGGQGTAFLINESQVITARHCIVENLNNSTPILLEFYVGTSASLIIEAIVFVDSLEHDIAVLQLDQKIENIQKWFPLDCTNYESRDDYWETIGYPQNWDVEKEESNYCYLLGNLYLDNNFDSSKTYDKQLTSSYIKEEWPYGLAGLSGAPLVVNNKLVGIIIKEEYSAIKSQLKAVSFNKCADFLMKNGIPLDLSFSSNSEFLNIRLQQQKDVCKELFNKIDHTLVNNDLKLNFDFYYLKYDGSGNKRINELALHLAQVLAQYACGIADIAAASQDLRKHLEIFQKMSQLVSKIQKDGKLGTILLWMLMEGILEVPKMFTQIRSSDLNYVSNDVHIGMKNSQLILYSGAGILSQSFDEGISVLIEELETITDMSGASLFYDQYSLESLGKGPLKTLLEDFYDYRDWSKVGVEITVFTGYDSKLLEQLERNRFTGVGIERQLASYFRDELTRNHEYLCTEILKTTDFKKVKINWFLLPFNTITDFEELLLSKLL
ncbi:Hachiman antiphage defense system protein HamA [Paenibacillus glycanilyticus]|uniref:Hachiman antiphage defense system protein HamA n=1 Tax=Paenibacillus glycanilyticus TaxID=126569 RepID=UPI001910D606|nr:Hachiman antiphage defense system protein HamA [Paenibacillus glycanilyticus]